MARFSAGLFLLPRLGPLSVPDARGATTRATKQQPLDSPVGGCPAVNRPGIVGLACFSRDTRTGAWGLRVVATCRCPSTPWMSPMSTPRSPSVVGALHAGIVAEEHEREQPHGVGESSGDADAADRVLH